MEGSRRKPQIAQELPFIDRQKELSLAFDGLGELNPRRRSPD
jgi:hypothetical protein